MVVFAGTLFLLEQLRRARKVATPEKAERSIPPSIAAKLPPRLRNAAIIALQAQDHYVNVITSSGNAMVHARFGDLVSSLRRVSGAQVHRSWWVALDAVQDVRLREGRSTLLLMDGTMAPLSRGFASRLRRDERHPLYSKIA